MIAEARQALADALADLGIPVHSYPPKGPGGTFAAVVPGFPYLTPQYLGSESLTLGLQVQITSPNPHALDTHLEAAVLALIGAGIPPSPVPPPEFDDELGTLTVRIPVTFDWKE